ncbi:MAG: TetR family transcriptional regulator [Bacteroidetes bacterium]|nr:TetR family transcriptional regulator [Bacteroidota bacterium]
MRLRDIQKEESISAMAVQIAVEEGLDGLTMNKLAKAAGVSPATIYIYFKDRDDMLLQVAIREEQKMFSETLEGFDPEMSFEDGLRHQWEKRAAYFMADPYRLRFMEQLKNTRFHEEVRKCGQSYSSVLKQFMLNAIANKQLRPLTLEVYWALAYAPLYRLIKFHLNKKGMMGRTFQLNKADFEEALSIVLKGLRPD